MPIQLLSIFVEQQVRFVDVSLAGGFRGHHGSDVKTNRASCYTVNRVVEMGDLLREDYRRGAHYHPGNRCPFQWGAERHGGQSSPGDLT